MNKKFKSQYQPNRIKKNLKENPLFLQVEFRKPTKLKLYGETLSTLLNL